MAKNDKSMGNHAIYDKKIAKSQENVRKEKYQQFKNLFIRDSVFKEKFQNLEEQSCCDNLRLNVIKEYEQES